MSSGHNIAEAGAPIILAPLIHECRWHPGVRLRKELHKLTEIDLAIDA